MKACIVVLFLLSVPLSVSADFVKWMGNYDAAHQKALKEQKPLLVLLVKKNAPNTSKQIHDIFMDRPYVGKINTGTVPVIVTYEGELSYPIEMYYTTVFPTLFFVDSSRELFLHDPLCGNEINVNNVKKVFVELFN